jgi:hypothetical protein
MDAFDYTRLSAWAKNLSREPANTAFTEGELRDAARVFEDVLPELLANVRAAAYEQARWQPIETAPKDGTWQVVAHFDGKCFYWWHRARFFKGQWRTGSGIVCPSYYLPLPVVETEENISPASGQPPQGDK